MNRLFPFVIAINRMLHSPCCLWGSALKNKCWESDACSSSCQSSSEESSRGAGQYPGFIYFRKAWCLWPATWEQMVTEKLQLNYSESFCLGAVAMLLVWARWNWVSPWEATTLHTGTTQSLWAACFPPFLNNWQEKLGLQFGWLRVDSRTHPGIWFSFSFSKASNLTAQCGRNVWTSGQEPQIPVWTGYEIIW